MEGDRAGRFAIVSGANKGIGYEICKQLAEKGISVVLTARDEGRGKEAIRKLKLEMDASNDDVILFHQLDVADPASIATLVGFIKNKFGKLDILVNNAAISGVNMKDSKLNEELIEAESRRIVFDEDMVNLPTYNTNGLLKCLLLFCCTLTYNPEEIQLKALANIEETYDIARQCLQINYYGAKRMVEAFIPLLQLSDAPRIVNVSSSMGKLKLLNNEWAKNILSNTESLTEDKVDEVINEFLKHLKEGHIQRKNWPFPFSSYKVAKASLNAYTRITSRKYPEMRINCICPGYVQTDINFGTGPLTPKEGAESVVSIAMLPEEGPSGLFFYRQEVTSF